MKCEVCGHDNAENAVFCAQCGTLLRDAGSDGVREEVGKGSGEVPKGNQWTDEAKRISRNFFEFCMGNLRSPSQFVKEVDRNQLLNGIIVMILLSLIPPLFMYLSMVNTPFRSFVRISFFNVVIQPSVFLFLFFLLITGLLFVAVKMKALADFQTVMARFGASLVLPAAFSLAGLVLGILSAQLTMFFMGFAYIGILLSIYITLQSFQRNMVSRPIDDLYYFFAIILVLIIIASMFAQSMVKHIIGQIMVPSLF
ncbi:zinc ribbon domain-containing protein [Thermicanus aegyptius]|uniref:zinc ribbon domain-containing protein n=1 Tax=Thermicanus aegyptius TaxID=94009 RepID=UPI000415519D|nr:zinc ribbon domain-containing protein [Thermicanus aegyptius]